MKAAVSLLLALCVACGPGASRGDDERRPRSPASVPAVPTGPSPAELALRAEVETLRARVDVLEQRLGLRPFSPTTLTQAAPGMVLELPATTTLVEAAGAPDQRGRLGVQLKGSRGAVITYWATWCKPCTTDEELAYLRTLQAQLKGAGLQLFSIGIDGLDKIRGHARSAAWLYPLWHLDNGHLEMLPKAFIDKAGVGLPLFLVVDPAGEIRWFRNQALDPTALVELVTAAAAAR